MIFQRIKTPGIAHVAYLIGARGEAALVDPRRDIDAYLRRARAQGLTIRYVVETHRQEDFVLGSAELARVTGAQIVNGRHELFGHGDRRLADGEELTVGGIRLRALATPGHTPESVSYAIFIPDSPARAWGLFSGDTLFIGETGRTDLPDRTRTGENAGLLYDAVHAKLAPLGDQTLLFPAHGSGSVCGGQIADRDQSTIGLERGYNPVFTQSRAAFMAAKIAERIPRPPYFARMEQLNLRGGMALARRPVEVRLVPPEELERRRRDGIVIDARDPEAFAGGHIPGAYNVWAAGLPVFGGWIAQSDTPIYLVLPSPSALDEAVLALARIGVDGVRGALAGGFDAWRNAGLPFERLGTVGARTLADERERPRVLDVRADAEFEAAHIPGASHLYVGYLDEQWQKVRPPLSKDERIVVTCSVGHRAGLAASVLRRHGFSAVENLLGGMKAWQARELATEAGGQRSVTTPEVEGERR